MSTTKQLPGECQHCGGHLEFPAESVGTVAECPLCGQQTDLFMSTAKTIPARAATKAIVFTVIAIVILIGGLIGSIVALNRAKRLTAEHDKGLLPAPKTNTIPTGPFGGRQFSASEIKLQKSSGGSVVRAVGLLKNHSTQRRFAVRVEIELLDDLERPVGTTTDYAATIEPEAVWEFKALVLVKNAVSARVTEIKEEK